jgi:predicted RNA-binding Zn ribbon-like protein
MSYPGPLRDEPLALELHNTRYAAGGVIVDGLADDASASAWLAAVGTRLPAGGRGAGPTARELTALRDAVRAACGAVLDGASPSRGSIEAINAASRRAAGAPVARWLAGASPEAALDFGDSSRADVVLSALAGNAVELLTGPQREQVRACGAPGCVLRFLRSHPRRAWCSAACGNRARQARHYARTRQG